MYWWLWHDGCMLSCRYTVRVTYTVYVIGYGKFGRKSSCLRYMSGYSKCCRCITTCRVVNDYGTTDYCAVDVCGIVVPALWTHSELLMTITWYRWHHGYSVCDWLLQYGHMSSCLPILWRSCILDRLWHRACMLNCFAGIVAVISGQNHLATHSERGQKTRETEKEVGR